MLGCKSAQKVKAIMFTAFMIIVIIMNASLVATLIRLKEKHNDVFTDLGLSNTFFGSPKQLAKVTEFVIKRKNVALKDSFLTCSGYVFVASFVTTIIAIYASIF
jgi:hypothetical protein